jgi:hypothetical protein
MVDIFFCQQIWESLVQPDNKIKKVKDDFQTRHGVTQKPLADIDWIGRFFRCLAKLVLVRLKGRVWS